MATPEQKRHTAVQAELEKLTTKYAAKQTPSDQQKDPLAESRKREQK